MKRSLHHTHFLPLCAGMLTLACVIGLLAFFGSAGATGAAFYKQTASIVVPDLPAGRWMFDGGWVDPSRHLYYQTDVSAHRVDVIDLAQKKPAVVGAIPGFTGPDPSGTYQKNGPNHVLGIGVALLAISNGDSHVLIYDTSTLQHPMLLATVPTGGKNRADGLAYDARLHLLAVVNPDETAPFVSFVNTRTFRVEQRLSFSQAAGLDDIVFDPISRHFLLSVTGTPHSEHPYGAVAELDPVHQTVAQWHHLPFVCDPSGLALLPDRHATDVAIACSAGNPLILHRNGAHDHITQIKDCDGGDFVTAIDEHHFAFALSGDIAGSRLVIADETGEVEQVLPMVNGSHSVTSDERGTFFVPQTGKGIVIYREEHV